MTQTYSTQMEAAKLGIVTPQMAQVAEDEGIDAEVIRERVARGTIAIPANHNHPALHAHGVGEGLRTKINVNLGISGDERDYECEMQKVRTALEFDAEAIMDLSNYGKTHDFRRALVDMSPAMIGTVPMYDAVGYLEKDLGNITAQDFLDVVRAHAEEGVDFVTIHAGLNRKSIDSFKRSGRMMNIVSRGGSLIYAWMEMTGNENPFFEHYDELLDILYEYDVTISLGDALRPGCVSDSTDAGQVSELIELGLLTTRAWERNVQVMIEGPGHMALNEIAANMQIEKTLCHNAPFYVLGPLVTDIAPGYDHITSAIGGAIAAANGADFLCYVTPAPAERAGCTRGRYRLENCRARRRLGERRSWRSRLGRPHGSRTPAPRLARDVRRGHRPQEGRRIRGEHQPARPEHLHHVRRHVLSAHHEQGHEGRKRQPAVDRRRAKRPWATTSRKAC